MPDELISDRHGGIREKRELWLNTPMETLVQYLVITVGAAIFGISLTLFMLPYKIAPGGISGLVVILNHESGIPAGLLMLAFNIPIFLLGLKFLGGGFGLKSLYGTVMISVFTDLTNEALGLSMPIEDAILAPLFGGVVMGAGLGLIIKMGGATSGSGTIARIIARHTNLTHGTAILILNGLIIGVAGFVFQSADLAMYGLISLWISSFVIDAIMEGMDYARGVFIITNRVETVADAILHTMGRGGTALKGRGLYTNMEREIVFCVVTRKEIHDLVRMVRKIDPKAFVVISQVYEVLGEGFRPRV